MKMTFRWYGDNDPVALNHISQIPGVRGIVSAVYDVPVGEVWPYETIMALKAKIERAGLRLEVIESVPVHEDIKLGRPTRDRYIQNYITTIRNLSKADVKVICYNFMAVFDWTRSSLEYELPDGSTALIYEENEVKKMNPLLGDLKLPGWDTSYSDDQLKVLLEQYQNVTEEDLWRNLEYFIKSVIPVAEEEQVKMAIHPDDPPWSIFGLPRIITNQQNLERFVNLYDSSSNGLCLCSGSLGANPENDLVKMVEHFGYRDKINFVHARNIKRIGDKSFHESAHLSEDGSIDMYEFIRALCQIGYTGPIRPDHGRMIWGEKGRPGYGLHDRALGATYLNGIWEAVYKEKQKVRIK